MTIQADPSAQPVSVLTWIRSRNLEPRFVAPWAAVAILLLFGLLFYPQSVSFTTLMAIAPLAAFLALASTGQAIVLMARGIDLSAPAAITVSSTVLLGVTNGADAMILPGIIAALLAACALGLVNGFLIAIVQLNALIVTLATGAIASGIILWYRQGLPAEASVPAALSDFGSLRILGVNTAVWITVLVIVGVSLVLNRTPLGRQFQAVGASPMAARATGVRVVMHQAGSFVLAALIYGVVGILLSAFIRNPTLDVGAPYLIATIAAAVLGGTPVTGGKANLFSVLAAAVFLTQLGQALKVAGLSTAFQMMVEGLAIGLGMWLSRSRN